MSSISANGATQSISLDMSGTSIAYTITGGSRILITTWPVTINNSNPGSSSILNVKATQGLTISSSTGGTSGYFIAGTTYITFDGSGNTITIDTITSYPGFIQNGTSGANGKSNIAVKNFTTTISGASTLAVDAGWLCQIYFSKAVAGNTITSCTNNGAINNSACGGIVGGSAAGNSGVLDISGCTNTGSIDGIAAGGIVGAVTGFQGTCNITKCISTGNITNTIAGGIAGSRFAYNSNTTNIISNCYSIGNISGTNAGGIVGADVGFTDSVSFTPVVDISNCYSLGTIATSCGGICGGYDGSPYTNKATINITNSYSYGALSGTGSGLVAASLTSANINLTTTNTYVAAGSWTDAAANAALTGTPTSLTSGNPGTTWTKVASGTTGNPYVLAAYNAALYSPSSATSTASSYTTSAGLFTDPSYNYQIVYTSQSGNTATTRVFVSKGTSPQYHSYNSNTFAITNNERGSPSATITSSTGVLSYTFGEAAPCFLEGTQILCLEHGQEVYRPIESLRKGDLVKTLRNGYLPIDMIGTTRICNPGNSYRTSNRLYKCSKEKYPDLFEDLYITGCHSILVPWLTYEQAEKTTEYLGRLFVTDNHCRLMAWLDENAEPFNNDGYFSIYHIALENSDSYMNYGIYANGLLVETCSKRYLRELSGMRLLGEEDCTASQSMQVDNVFNKITNLIETC